MITHRKYWFFMAFFLLSATSWAEEWEVPPPLNPPNQPVNPWIAPTPSNVPPGFAPVPQDPSYAPVPMPPSFDSFDEEDEEMDTGSSQPSEREGKSSFQLLQNDSAPGCLSWGHPLLGPTTFSNKGTCGFELSRKIDHGTSAIESLTEQFDRFKIKQEIQGRLSRGLAETFQMDFRGLQKVLQKASKEGCTCQK